MVELVGCAKDDLQCILQEQLDAKKAAEKAANVTANGTANATADTNEDRMLYFFSQQAVDYSKLGLARTVYENKTLDHLDIKNYVKMMIKRGANDSSEVNLLEFDFTLVEFERNYLMFWLDF